MHHFNRFGRTEFDIKLIGKTNCIHFYYWRQELFRIQSHLQQKTRKRWIMNIDSQSCNEQEFQSNIDSLQNLDDQSSPVIQTDDKTYTSLQQFITQYLQRRLGITEMNRFPFLKLQEIEQFMVLDAQESLKEQLTSNQFKEFAYFKFVDDSIDEVISILVQFNKNKCGQMISVFKQYLEEEMVNPNSGAKITFIEKKDFEFGEGNFTGGFTEVSGFPMIEETEFQKELKEIKHEQGTFGLNMQQNTENGLVLKVGLNFMLEKNEEFDQDSQMMGLGHILYGFSQLKNYIEKKQVLDEKQSNVNLRLIEAQLYNFNSDDFIRDGQQYKFKPKKVEKPVISRISKRSILQQKKQRSSYQELLEQEILRQKKEEEEQEKERLIYLEEEKIRRKERKLKQQQQYEEDQKKRMEEIKRMKSLEEENKRQKGMKELQQQLSLKQNYSEPPAVNNFFSQEQNENNIQNQEQEEQKEEKQKIIEVHQEDEQEEEEDEYQKKQIEVEMARKKEEIRFQQQEQEKQRELEQKQLQEEIRQQQQQIREQQNNYSYVYSNNFVSEKRQTKVHFNRNRLLRKQKQQLDWQETIDQKVKNAQDKIRKHEQNKKQNQNSSLWFRVNPNKELTEEELEAIEEKKRQEELEKQQREEERKQRYKEQEEARIAEEKQREKELEEQRKKEEEEEQERLRLEEEELEKLRNKQESEDEDDEDEDDFFDDGMENAKPDLKIKNFMYGGTSTTKTSTGETTVCSNTLSLVLSEQSQIQEEKLDQEEIDEEYEINEQNLLFLYDIGKGSFGTVQAVIDNQSKRKYAKKVFSKATDFLEERNLMQNLQEVFQGNFTDIGAGMEKYDNKSRTIFYDCGECSLQEFIQVRRRYKVFWFRKEQEIVYIMQEIIKIFEIMFKNSVFHSDLKPENIILKKYNKKNHYYIKLIDFGSASQDPQQVKGITENYALPNIREVIMNKDNLTLKKRKQIEYYTLGRTIQALMLSSIWEKENSYNNRQYFENNEAGIEKSMEKLRQYYSEKVVAIVELLLKQQAISKVKAKIKELQKQEIIDENNIIPGILKLKQEEAEEIIEIDDKNINYQLQKYWENNLHIKALTIIEQLDSRLQKDVQVIYWKMKFLKDLDSSQADEYIREIFFKIDKPMDFHKQTPEFQWAYYSIQLQYYQRMHQPSKQTLCLRDVSERFSETSKYYGEALYLQANYYNSMKDFEKVVELLEECLEIFYEVCPEKNELIIADTLQQLGYFKLQDALQLNQQLDLEKERLYQDEKEKAANIKEKQQEIEVVTDQAIKYLEQGREIRIKISGNNNIKNGMTLNHLATCYSLKMDKKKIVELTNYSMEIFEHNTGYINKNSSELLFLRGNLLDKMGLKDEALEAWEYALTILRSIESLRDYFDDYFQELLNTNYFEADFLERVNKFFIPKSYEFYKIQDYKNSLNQAEIGQHIVTCLKGSQRPYSRKYFEQTERKLFQRKKLAEIKISQQQSIDRQDNLQQQIKLLKIFNIENTEDYFEALIQRCQLEQDINGKQKPIQILKDYKENIDKMFKNLETEIQDLLDKYQVVLVTNKKKTGGKKSSVGGAKKSMRSSQSLSSLQKVQPSANRFSKTKIGAKGVGAARKSTLKQKEPEVQKTNEEILADLMKNIVMSQTPIEKTTALQNYEKEQKNQRNQIMNSEHKKNLMQSTMKISKKRLEEVEIDRIDKINELIQQQQDIYCNFYIKLHDYQLDDFQYDEALASIRKALIFANDKTLISQAQARVLLLLQYTQQSLEQENEQISKLEGQDLKFDIDMCVDKLTGEKLFNFLSDAKLQISDFIFKQTVQLENNSQVIQRQSISYQSQQSLEPKQLNLFVAFSTLKLNNNNRKFAFKMQQGQFDFCGIGICDVQKIDQKNCRVDDYKSQGHGLYMITPNGDLMNTANPKENFNNNLVSNFQFGLFDIIICEYIPQRQILKFTKDGTNQSTTLHLKLNKQRDYAVSVALPPNSQDVISIISNIEDLGLYRTEKQRIFETIEEQMYYYENQISKNTKKFSSLLREIARQYYIMNYFNESKEKLNHSLKLEQNSSKKLNTQASKDNLKDIRDDIKRVVDRMNSIKQ